MNTKVVKEINSVIDGLYQQLNRNSQPSTNQENMSKHDVSIIPINIELK